MNLAQLQTQIQRLARAGGLLAGDSWPNPPGAGGVPAREHHFAPEARRPGATVLWKKERAVERRPDGDAPQRSGRAHGLGRKEGAARAARAAPCFFLFQRIRTRTIWKSCAKSLSRTWSRPSRTNGKRSARKSAAGWIISPASSSGRKPSGPSMCGRPAGSAASPRAGSGPSGRSQPGRSGLLAQILVGKYCDHLPFYVKNRFSSNGTGCSSAANKWCNGRPRACACFRRSATISKSNCAKSATCKWMKRRCAIKTPTGRAAAARLSMGGVRSRPGRGL